MTPDRCVQCGRTDFVVSVVVKDLGRYCRTCWREGRMVLEQPVKVAPGKGRGR